MISSVLPKLIEPLGDMKQLVTKFRVAGDETRFDLLFSKDETCQKIQRQLDAGWFPLIPLENRDKLTHSLKFPEAEYCFSKLQNYAKSWDTYREIWETNKDLFIKRSVTQNYKKNCRKLMKRNPLDTRT